MLQRSEQKVHYMNIAVLVRNDIIKGIMGKKTGTILDLGNCISLVTSLLSFPDNTLFWRSNRPFGLKNYVMCDPPRHCLISTKDYQSTDYPSCVILTKHKLTPGIHWVNKITVMP